MPTNKKTTAKKATTARKTTAKKTVAKRSAAKRTAAKRTTAASTPTSARRGDVIVVDSRQVGSPPREGEVLEVIEGGVGVSYRVKWIDGHESIYTPAGGVLHRA